MTNVQNAQAAIRDAIQTEKDAMDFYLFGAEKLSEERAREVFELLAREERQHAKMFYKVYKGEDIPSFDEYMKSAPDTASGWWKALQQIRMGDFDERKVLELALEQEEALEKQLREMASQITDPEIRAIYEANANSTHHHGVLIEEEYRAMFGMS
jgi:rubrerythrin